MKCVVFNSLFLTFKHSVYFITIDGLSCLYTFFKAFMTKKAVLLTNLGSPDKPEKKQVRNYLNQFLMDRYVIHLPWIIRRILVSLFVLPKRPKTSAEAYQSIWTTKGSPLLLLSEKLKVDLQEQS